LVAGPSLGRYSSPVRRHFFQRWSIILLLVMRLIAGEFAHAMPHHMESHDAPSAAIPATAPCPDHAGKMPQVDVSVASAPQHGSGDADCCNTAACKCLCVHITAMVTPPPTMNCAAFVQLRVPLFADGLLLYRPSALFRPPA
jgi:hypothetical protein